MYRSARQISQIRATSGYLAVMVTRLQIQVGSIVSGQARRLGGKGSRGSEDPPKLGQKRSKKVHFVTLALGQGPQSTKKTPPTPPAFKNLAYGPAGWVLGVNDKIDGPLIIHLYVQTLK